MTMVAVEGFEKSPLKVLLEHFAAIEDPREPWRVAHPLPEVLLLVVCGTIRDCEDCDLIADWGEAHLDVVFNDDQSRLRKGHGAANMAIVRHFAFNLVRAVNDERSIKLRRKRAGWDPEYLAAIFGNSPR